MFQETHVIVQDTPVGAVPVLSSQESSQVLQSQPPSTPSLKEEAPSAVDTGIQFTH